MSDYFFQETIPDTAGHFVLDEKTSKHLVQVLRKQEGASLSIVDGKGKKASAFIHLADRKHCEVIIHKIRNIHPCPHKLSLGVAFTKHSSRNEWLLEKATELGVENIYPIITQRTERIGFNQDRLNNILIAAMLQSQQLFLPILHQPVRLIDLAKKELPFLKLVAHCLSDYDGVKLSIIEFMKAEEDILVLIGPEGDFTREEVAMMESIGFKSVSLGQQRLRTETAGLYACLCFNIINHV